MLESISVFDLTPELDKLYKEKIDFLESIPKLLHTVLKKVLPNNGAASPSDANGYYEDIEKMLNGQ
jgi:hypothetical protein